MSEDEIKKLQTRARYVASKRGYSQLADDFAQEIFVEFLQNPDRGATIDQLFIDYLRRTHGRPGTPGGDARVLANHTISIDAHAQDDEYKEIQLPSHPPYGDTDDDSRLNRDVGRLDFLFRGREAEIYRLYFVEELSEKSIGDLYGITESRVSQILKPMKKEIQDYYATQELRERSEWDESFGIFQIDWIRL